MTRTEAEKISVHLYDHSTRQSLDTKKTLEELSTHQDDVIREAILYKTPLTEKMTIVDIGKGVITGVLDCDDNSFCNGLAAFAIDNSMDLVSNPLSFVKKFNKYFPDTGLTNWLTKSVLYHGFLVYNACENPNKCLWWSAERTSDGILLQKSESLYDVIHYSEGKQRMKKEETPDVMVHDKCSNKASIETVKELIEQNTSSKFNLANNNSKAFAKALFNEISLNKKWRPIVP